MTPRISLITAVVAAALAVGAPAAFADPWGADQIGGRPVIGSPDNADRVIAARQKELARVLDARERSLGAARAGAGDVRMVQTGRPYVGDGGDRFTIDAATTPVTVASIQSSRRIEWPQIGLGALLGVGLTLGLMFVLRTTRGRELAH